ncbi:histone-lysine N-methyltransferase ATXR2 isoform X1 [Carex littledalei]|uniref:Histone-lysine N-methyltransferase ATXR2 isoform X1 n=1 Tax=Carex littledalei TaxID=544730 RepID=A0A833V5B5_9POAL|nr:histone-lysine N-methyltransferase ATXR2 isoform X1 [Carex littledalei]
MEDEYSDQIAALLAPPSSQSIQEYYNSLKEAGKCDGLNVRDNGKHGKAVFASREFKEGELILKDQMLVGAQHSSNKVDCLVCSYCFRFIGSVEAQIGRRLYLQSLGIYGEKECEKEHPIHSTNDKMERDLPPKEMIESLLNGDLSLPFTNRFELPEAVPCPGGCEEEQYCSQSCADADWETYHSLLCTSSSNKQSSVLLKFIEHANETNDIFIVAAKAIAFTMLRYRKLKKSQAKDKGKGLLGKMDNTSFSLLLEAWKPISMGFKRRWWECISLPDDVDPTEEVEFRTEIRDLASTSLELLKDAIFDAECAPLFSLDVYGSIIGMFELNNLDLVVASPIEDYFIYIDELADKEKEEALTITRTFLDALGDDYSVSCQGTAFFPIQSCMNHSCCPNAKAFKRDEDIDGHAIILASHPISIGEEVTLSYIDEDVPYDKRQAMLADYGFTCTCPRCLEDCPN